MQYMHNALYQTCDIVIDRITTQIDSIVQKTVDPDGLVVLNQLIKTREKYRVFRKDCLIEMKPLDKDVAQEIMSLALDEYYIDSQKRLGY